MDTNLIFIILVVLIALIFDFTNGFHDTANSIATIIATGILSPINAVLWATFFNIIAFLIFKLSVASTIGVGLVNASLVDTYFVFSALFAAISWNLLSWYYGLPSSSSHALIGGLTGAAITKGGTSALAISGLFKVMMAIFLSPLLAMIIGWLLYPLIERLAKCLSQQAEKSYYKYLQLLSSSYLSLAHGGNDAQKTMGVIAVLLYSNGFLGEKFFVPFWIVMACYLMIALGTLSGGWRIVNTMSQKITELTILRGSCAETAAATVIFAATDLGIPVSSTHVVTGAIASVGMTERLWGTNWKLMGRIFFIWIVTIPVTACIASLLMLADKKVV